MSGSRPVRVGLVGAGYVSRFHVAALRRLPGVAIAGITDIDHSRAQTVGEQFGLTSFPSLEDMAASGLQTVHVLTPPATHAAVALRAIALGCHVLIEKPLATSVEDCEALIVASRTKGVRVSVNHSLLALPLVVAALELVRRGAIGEVLTADFFRSSIYPPYGGGPMPPQYREGGYPFRDLGVHGLYLLQAFLGDIEDVSAHFRSVGPSKADPNLHFDEWRAVVTCVRGVGTIHLSWNVKPLQYVLVLQGTRGTLRADLSSMFLARRRHTMLPEAIERVVNPVIESVSSTLQVAINAGRFLAGRLRPYEGLHRAVAAFYRALERGDEMPVALESAREVVRWTEHVARQADEAKEQAYQTLKRGPAPVTVVTGASGHLGRVLVQSLLGDGVRVRALVRRPPEAELAEHPGLEVAIGDLGDATAVESALDGAQAVYHIGAATRGGAVEQEAGTITGTRNVVEACLKLGVSKLIYVSSLSVIDWAGHPSDRPVTEAAPLEPAPDARGDYTRGKLAAERIVSAAAAEHGLPAIILRPGQIWSETSRLLTPAVGIRIGRVFVIVGDRNSRIPFVHVDDVVRGLRLAEPGQSWTGEIVQLVDDDLMTREELVRAYARAREPGLRVIHVPLSLACLAVWLPAALFRAVLRRPPPVSAYRLRSAFATLRFDRQKALHILGWRPEMRSATRIRAMLDLEQPCRLAENASGSQ
jgi:predicted dehydrogenase/nucleoside-diphosphate-sugar epimerase